uniref:Uncharacterized protein n=1 Tax=Physcomitrium patens TaxID=3218 RepID=A0A2K1JZM1_PHYPA|nr:hypothetical protein PHYPA_014093 [Physcomitrium patens]
MQILLSENFLLGMYPFLLSNIITVVFYDLITCQSYGICSTILVEYVMSYVHERPICPRRANCQRNTWIFQLAKKHCCIYPPYQQCKDLIPGTSRESRQPELLKSSWALLFKQQRLTYKAAMAME